MKSTLKRESKAREAVKMETIEVSNLLALESICDRPIVGVSRMYFWGGASQHQFAGWG